MKRHAITSMLSLSMLAVAAFLLGTTVPAQAQPAPPAGIGGPGGAFPGMGSLTSIDTSRMDPTRTVIGFLLKRDDVRTAILLEARQREKLDDFDTQQQQTQQKAMMDILQKARAALTGIQGLSADEQQTKIEELKTQAETTMQNIQKDQDKSLAEILKPGQLARLKELDLQWRGPMAMGDPKLAESMGLNKEENAAIDAAIKEYRSVMLASFQNALPPALRNRFGNGAAPNGPNAPQDAPAPEQRKQQQETAQKDVEKARALAGSKIVKALTDAHKQKWETLQGKPFKFRLIN